MIDILYRSWNGIRKLASGLRPFSESVWPGARTDLFVAHESIYWFASRYAAGQSVLDAGCGTGYGSHVLATSGAARVLGVDIDRRNIAFARKRFRVPNLTFEVRDLEQLDTRAPSYGFVVASNSIEHLNQPERFLRQLVKMLEPGGKALIAVPPIYTQADAHVHANIRYHRANRTVGEWSDTIEQTGLRVSAVLHEASQGVSPDFFAHSPSHLRSSDFNFSEVPVGTLLTKPSITAIFLLERRRPS